MKLVFIEQGCSYKNKFPNIPNDLSIFTKPDTALLRNNEDFYVPQFTKEIVCKLKFAVRINKIGKHIETKFTRNYYEEIGIGVEFLAIDRLREIKEQGGAWDTANAFDRSTAISCFLSKNDFKDLDALSFQLHRNSVLIEDNNTSDFIHSIDNIIAYASQFFTLKIGDVVFISSYIEGQQIKIGDSLSCNIQDKVLLNFRVQ